MPDPSEDVLAVPQGEFHVDRHPRRPNERLRAWDAADDLLLLHLGGEDPPALIDWGAHDAMAPVLIVDDAFGALGLALADRSPTVLSDSYCTHSAVRSNAARHGLEPTAVALVPPVHDLVSVLGRPATVLIRPNRNLALLEHHLRSILPLLRRGDVVVGTAMTKHLHTSTLEVFERVIGPTRTSRAHRHARLLESTFDASAVPGGWSWPRRSELDRGLQVAAQPGVFSAGRLDRGTALLLANLPSVAGQRFVVDLGCGTGVLGTGAALTLPGATVTFVDDSWLAVESARATFAASAPDAGPGRFRWGNGLFDWADGAGVEPGTVDLVLNNPPFHDDHAVGDAIAWQMFDEAHRALRIGGELRVVGNRHLGYHAKLRRRFGNCEVVASDPKFVVLRAVR